MRCEGADKTARLFKTGAVLASVLFYVTVNTVLVYYKTDKTYDLLIIRICMFIHSYTIRMRPNTVIYPSFRLAWVKCCIIR